MGLTSPGAREEDEGADDDGQTGTVGGEAEEK